MPKERDLKQANGGSGEQLKTSRGFSADTWILDILEPKSEYFHSVLPDRDTCCHICVLGSVHELLTLLAPIFYSSWIIDFEYWLFTFVTASKEFQKKRNMPPSSFGDKNEFFRWRGKDEEHVFCETLKRTRMLWPLRDRKQRHNQISSCWKTVNKEKHWKNSDC